MEIAFRLLIVHHDLDLYFTAVVLMSRYRKLLVFILAGIIILSGCGNSSDSKDNLTSFTILQTSDLHHHAAGFGPASDYTPFDTQDNDSVLGGYARIAAVIQNIRNEQTQQGIPVLVVDSGDFL